MSAVQGSAQVALIHLHVPFDVVQYHDGLIDQNSDRQGQSSQSHRVDGIAGKVESNQ